MTAAIVLGAALAIQPVTHLTLAQGKAPDVGWTLLEPGIFRMGCVQADTECDDLEVPHGVTISRSFQIMTREATLAQYRAFVEATGVAAPAPPRYEQEDTHPMVNLTWDDAAEFCEWAGGRLPTEAMWEYAARGGKDNEIYPWGNEASHEMANYGAETCCSGLAAGRDQWVNTAPVGSFPPNGFGLYDMSGNVWEWVSDWFDEYPAAQATDPGGPSSGVTKIVRGGSWLNIPKGLRSSGRLAFASFSRVSNVGVRCVRDVSTLRAFNYPMARLSNYQIQ